MAKHNPRGVLTPQLREQARRVVKGEVPRDRKGRFLSEGSYQKSENPGKKKRKGPAKGKTPAHLRKYQFKKGHR